MLSEILESKIKQQPEDARFHSSLGIVYAGLGRKEDAIREGQLAVDLLPVTKEAWKGLFRIEDLARVYGRPFDPSEHYEREPFAVDVSVGKTNQLYRAHGYHTKVPHLAITPSILHYTKPGDIVLDGFCGSGMTCVAAQWCGTAPLDFRRGLKQRWKDDDR